MASRQPYGGPKDPDNPYRQGQTNEKGTVICGAKLRNRTEKCLKRPMTNGRCHLHGGKNLAGPMSGTFRTGRHSKYLPTHLIDRYNQSLEDAELMELRAEISLMDTRITELVERTSRNESSAFWFALSDSWEEFVTAIKNKDVESQQKLLPKLNGIIRGAVSSEKSWADVQVAVETRRRLTETEQKRLVTTQQMLPLPQVLMLMSSIVQSLKEVVYAQVEPQVARQIIVGASERYRKYLGAGPNPDITGYSMESG